MPEFEKFEFDRSRGVVWVCDLVGSSKFLNDNKTADSLEQFLPRLYWVSSLAVEAAGGRFIKWTGDGFLAWFETPLYRDLGKRASIAFQAAYYLTLLLNTTQLGIQTEKKFRIRHGMAYEQDALLTKIKYFNGHESLDLTGRAVVLAFRLSGIQASFPGIATQKEIVDAASSYSPIKLTFKKWDLKQEERLKYFKGESWGIHSIYTTGQKKTRPKSLKSILKEANAAIALAEGKISVKNPVSDYTEKFIYGLLEGPDWCKEVAQELGRFINEGLLGTLKKLTGVLSTLKDKASTNESPST